MVMKCWGVLYAVLVCSPVQAEEINPMTWLLDQPYLKAYAYGLAVDRYCFHEPRFAARVEEKDRKGAVAWFALSLLSKAQAQALDRYDPYDAWLGGDGDHGKTAMVGANAQLRNDLSACPPAISFVSSVLTRIEQSGSAQDAMVDFKNGVARLPK